MVRMTIAALLTLAVSVLAFDPAGAKNVGNGHGGQFIGGQCLSSADCASACCAFITGGGQCSGVGAQFQAGKQGCGFGDAGATPKSGTDTGSTAQPPTAPPSAPAAPAGFDASVGDPAGAHNLGNGQAKQFITGACLSNADCASTCCAGLRGGAVCSGIGAQFQNGKQGCGFSSGKRSIEVAFSA